MPFKYREPVDRLIRWSLPEEMPREGQHEGCWTWIGMRNNVGRPMITVRIRGKVKKITVARYIVQFVHGEKWGRNLSRRRVGAHECDNLDCANPDHVKRTTQKKNVRDCVDRDRHVSGWREYNRERARI